MHYCVCLFNVTASNDKSLFEQIVTFVGHVHSLITNFFPFLPDPES